jgi:hypothetical protein
MHTDLSQKGLREHWEAILLTDLPQKRRCGPAGPVGLSASEVPPLVLPRRHGKLDIISIFVHNVEVCHL